MKPIDRRHFLKSSLLGVSAVPLLGQVLAAAKAGEADIPDGTAVPVRGIIDTNINLFKWPFRSLKYGDTRTLVEKLRKHRVIEAWAGSFEALLSKDMHGVNTRLAEECREYGPGFLIPFGSVNLAWPDWQEDVRRCHEVHAMPGIRIYPGYQPFDLGHPALPLLVRMTSQLDLILQVVLGLEDPRVHHPIIDVLPTKLDPLEGILSDTPGAKVQLLHFPGNALPQVTQLMTHTRTGIDISSLEGNGAIGRILGLPPYTEAVQVPIDRILFGSHAPFFPLETAILKLIESPLDLFQLQAIMQGNGRRLLPRG